MYIVHETFVTIYLPGSIYLSIYAEKVKVNARGYGKESEIRGRSKDGRKVGRKDGWKDEWMKSEEEGGRRRRNKESEKEKKNHVH